MYAKVKKRVSQRWFEEHRLWMGRNAVSLKHKTRQ